MTNNELLKRAEKAVKVLQAASQVRRGSLGAEKVYSKWRDNCEDLINDAEQIYEVIRDLRNALSLPREVGEDAVCNVNPRQNAVCIAYDDKETPPKVWVECKDEIMGGFLDSRAKEIYRAISALTPSTLEPELAEKVMAVLENDNDIDLTERRAREIAEEIVSALKQ